MGGGGGREREKKRERGRDWRAVILARFFELENHLVVRCKCLPKRNNDTTDAFCIILIFYAVG